MITQEQLLDVIQANPQLCNEGWGQSNLKPASAERLERGRLELAAGLEGVNRAAEWLSKQEQTSAKSKSSRIRSSYGLKHVAEPEVGYTTNGEFIAAALILGIDVDTKSGDLNPSVGVLIPK